MKLATTTGDFDLFCDDYLECVKHVCEAGFRYIDLSMYEVHNDDALLIRDDWRDYVRKLKACADQYQATFVQAHSPSGNPLKTDSPDYEKLLATTIRSIEVCGELGIPNLVVHAGWQKGISKEEYFEKNKQFFERLIPAMERCNVNVLCENSTHANMGDMYYLISGADTKDFVSYVNHPLFHACWDTGHANIEGNQYEEILALGNSLKAVHINDNRGSADEHIIPYMGTLNMDEIMHALADNGYQGCFTFECNAALRSYNCWLGHRKRFEGDERLREPQLFMQKQVEKLLYEVGVYILKSYDCYEE